MTWFGWMGVLMAVTVGCNHVSAQRRPKWPENVRIVQAVMRPAEGGQVQGRINFEQMPNSVILTLHIEGLHPKTIYQVYLHRNQNCESIQLNSAVILSPRLRSNEKGLAEDTIRTEKISVSPLPSTPSPLYGASVVIRRSPLNSRDKTPVQVACGEVEPQSADLAFY